MRIGQMRIGNQYTSRGGEIKVDRAQPTVSSPKSSRTAADSKSGSVKSDIEVLREEMAGLGDDRSDLLAAVKARIGRGDYQTRASAEKVAEAVTATFGKH